MATPCALFASCSSLNPLEIIKQIICWDNELVSMPEPIPLIEEMTGYPWHVDTKYYTSDIQLCATDTRTIGDKAFADSVQAVVIHFDSTELSSFDQVKSWVPFVREIEPAVQILVCNRCATDDAIPKQRTLEWCLKNEFELVELYPILEDSDSDEDDFQETTGVKRIIQALHAHTWPNLEMKERPAFRSSLITQMMRDEAASQAQGNTPSLAPPTEQNVSNTPEITATDCTSTETCLSSNTNTTSSITENIPTDSELPSDTAGQDNRNTSQGNVGQETPEGASGGASAQGGNAEASSPCMSASAGQTIDIGKAKKEQKMKCNQQIIDSLGESEDMRLFAALGNEDPGEESFEQMFEKLRVMKEQAERMPPEERKKYAEQVAIQFWKSIGGEEEEILGLSDSD